ncbi:MAG: hypothetical protein ABJM06_06600 [Gilvibacter sp.]
MRLFLSVIAAASICIGCKSDHSEDALATKNLVKIDSTFNQTKWQKKVDGQYAHREIMYKDVLYNDTIRSLSETELTSLLGQPDYKEGFHYYYRITENNLGTWTLKSKTLVVKFTDSTKIEWIKLHE